jgi:hypothetical protein
MILRMKEKEEGISKGEYESGVLHSGRRYKNSRIVDEEREKHNEYHEHRVSIRITEVH